MRRFLAQMSAFWLIQAAIFAAFFAIYTRRTDDYLAASLDKERRLKTLPGPRLVLVGASNLAFGIDSAVLERRTGLRCVNMGLYAFLGLPFLFAEARDGLRPGDVVVLALEYHFYTHEQILYGQPMRWNDFFRLNPWASRHAPRGAVRHFPRIFSGWLGGFALVVREHDLGAFSHFVREAIAPTRLPPNAVYARHQFNKAGDLKMHREHLPGAVPATPLPLGANPAPAVTADAVALVERFVQCCRRRGVAVFLAAPVYPQPHYEAQKAALEEIQATLCRRVGAPLLVKGEEAALPLDRFFDTNYHLTSRGAVERSELLGRRLAETLDQPGQHSDQPPAH
jgi:hypothetical protein